MGRCQSRGRAGSSHCLSARFLSAALGPPCCLQATGVWQGSQPASRRAHITAEPGGSSQMPPTRCEYTLVSFCHLLLSLKNYISICFHTFLPSQPPLLEAYSMNPTSRTRSLLCLLEPRNIAGTHGVRGNGLRGQPELFIPPRPTLTVTSALHTPTPPHTLCGKPLTKLILLLVLISMCGFSIKNKWKINCKPLVTISLGNVFKEEQTQEIRIREPCLGLRQKLSF